MQNLSELPDELHDRHKLLLYYQDYLVNLLKTADEKKLSSINVKLSEPLEGEDLLDYLMNNEREEGYYTVSSHLFFSLLSDFTMYIGESIRCIESGKVSVAYSISRKPIKDSVFYLSQLLIDKKDFVRKVYYENPKTIDFSTKTPEEKLYVFKKASELIEAPEAGKVVYDFIFDKKSVTGLSRIWDQSLHLITQNRNYPTQKQNLNFVFADDGIWYDYWNYYYIVIPYIMKFAIEVITRLFEDIIEPKPEIKTFNKLIRDCKFLIHYSDEKEEAVENFKELVSQVSLDCDRCNYEYNLESVNINSMINDNVFTCPHCRKVERIGDYIT